MEQAFKNWEDLEDIVVVNSRAKYGYLHLLLQSRHTAELFTSELEVG